MPSVWKRQARVHATAGVLAVLCVLLAVAGPAAAQNPPPQEPGVTLRVFQLAGALNQSECRACSAWYHAPESA